MNDALQQGLKEYRDKVLSGELDRAEPLDPEEKARANPKSLRFAINAKCWACCCRLRKEVTLCEITDCSLHAMRPWQ